MWDRTRHELRRLSNGQVARSAIASPDRLEDLPMLVQSERGERRGSRADIATGGAGLAVDARDDRPPETVSGCGHYEVVEGDVSLRERFHVAGLSDHGVVGRLQRCGVLGGPH